jgi:hypothetical protein
VDAAQDQPPRNRHRPALADREGEAAESSPWDLKRHGQSADAFEECSWYVHREGGRDQGSEQDEGESLDDDRREDEDEGLNRVRLADAGRAAHNGEAN